MEMFGGEKDLFVKLVFRRNFGICIWWVMVMYFVYGGSINRDEI